MPLALTHIPIQRLCADLDLFSLEEEEGVRRQTGIQNARAAYSIGLKRARTI